jgi:antitoxin component YwqK of YwqJK toxin-antitoxin module
MKLAIPLKFQIIILSILFAVFLSSCGKEEPPKSSLFLKNNLLYKKDSNVPFTGKEKAKVKDKIIEYDVKDGYKQGEFKIYSLDGILEVSGQLDSNRTVGKWQYFHPNGILESEGNFYYDLPDGKWIWYYPDGKKKEEGFYTKGERVGTWFQYDREGKVTLEKHFDIGDSLYEKQDSVRT